jgi:hypothetical protein
VSDEKRKDEAPDVEGHIERPNHGEPVDEGEDENDVEAHTRRSNIRMD